MRHEVYDMLEPLTEQHRETEGVCVGRIEGVLMSSLPVTEGAEEAAISGLCKYDGEFNCPHRGKLEPVAGIGRGGLEIQMFNTCGYTPTAQSEMDTAAD